nr:mpv17-like protein 2 [Bactrocera oleae]
MSFFYRLARIAFGKKYLFYTNTGISFILSGVADIIDQSYEKYSGKRKEWSARRTFSMCVAGLCSGVVCHHWYIYLDKRFQATNLKTVMMKIVLDEVICSPVYLTVFFTTLGYMEGHSIEESLQQLRKKMWKIYRFEWMLWPPAQFINFYFLPTQVRVLYVYMISIIHITYTAHVTHESN